MIRFLQDHITKAVPAEVFTKGQELGDRTPESELHFVRRGVAAFVTDDGLVDHEGQPVTEGGDDGAPVDPVIKSAAKLAVTPTPKPRVRVKPAAKKPAPKKPAAKK